MPDKSQSAMPPTLRIVMDGDGPMASSSAIRALRLLARWALRKAQKRRHGVEEEVSKVVTGDFSKGSGPEEAAQLTCYGSTKR